MHGDLAKNVRYPHTGICWPFHPDCFFPAFKCTQFYAHPVGIDYLGDYFCRHLLCFFTFGQTKKYQEGGGHYEAAN